MVGHRRGFAAATALLALAAAAPANAQSATNEAWIGQTGDTNTITIIQTGIGNSAGANDSTLRINQDGRYNDITIDQLGWANTAGATILSQPGAPAGINQVGDRNVVEVVQDNLVDFGANAIGAIFQSSLTGLTAVANRLFVEQGSDGGDGSAGHEIGYVSQVNGADDLGTNVVRIFQSGGVAGIGNAIERLIQQGYANFVETNQSQQGNLVGSGRQIGAGNELVAIQGEGEDNTIRDVAQIGDLNRTRITQSGDRNYVDSVLQNNEGLAISGNRLVAIFAGDDNGGDGLGGAGAFRTAVAEAVGVYQGSFTQIGDDNDIAFTVNGGSDNMFGVFQDGDGNGAIVTISRAAGGTAPLAERNEVAVFQEGDDNNLSIAIVGDDNVVGATMRGERNRAAFSQEGDGNTIDISVVGNDNNNTASPSVGTFGGSAATLAAALSLDPGEGLQSGRLNSAVLRVTGNANLFAFSQSGEENALALTVAGSGNQTVIGQSNNLNAAAVKQTGTGNSMVIRQF